MKPFDMAPFDTAHHPLQGFQVIEASAGCGKTFALCTLFQRLVTETDIKAEEILVVTFTEAAALELKNRIRERIQASLNPQSEGGRAERLGVDQKKLREALSQMENAPISTIHGFCRKTLSEQAFESGMSFHSALEADTRAIFDEIACDFYVKNTALSSGLFTEYLDLLKFGPEQLAALLKTVSGRRGLLVLPDAMPVSDPTGEFSDAFFAAKESLESDRLGLERAIEGADIDRRTYRRDYISNRLDRLQNVLEEARPTPALANEDLKRFTSSALREKTRSGAPPSHPFIDAADELVRACDRFGEMLVQFKRRFVDESLVKLEHLKKERMLHTFDDLLQTLQEALEGAFAAPLKNALRARFKAVLIDEFQDTDAVQFDIFNRVFGGADLPFFVIGDPKQAVYRFRGGDIYTYLKAVRAAGSRRYGLTTNWRSDPSVVKAVNTLFSAKDNPFLLPEISFFPVSSRPGGKDAFKIGEGQGALEIRFIPRAAFGVAEDKPIPAGVADREMLAFVASDIESLLGRADDDGIEIAPSRIAVLVRTNEQAKRVRESLLKRGISAVLLKEESVYETEEAWEMRLLLRAVQNPTDPQALRTVLSTRLFGLFAHQIQSLFEETREWEPWADLMTHLRGVLQKSGMFSVMRRVLEFEMDGVTRAENVLKSLNGDRAVTNYRHLAELIEKYLDNGGALGEGLNLWFDRQCERAREGLDDDDDTELRIKGDAEAVRVLTMHKSKGLEFDIVYCPYLWNLSSEGRGDCGVLFHDPLDEKLTLSISTDPDRTHLSKERSEIEAENIRLAYVALTRARQRCLVTFGAFKTANASPLGRLFFDASVADTDARTDDEMLRDLKKLETVSDGAIRVSSLLSPLLGLEKVGKVLERQTLSARRFQGTIPAPLVTTSFTGLTSGRSDPVDEDEEEEYGRDTDFLKRENAPIDESLDRKDVESEDAMSLMNFDRGAAAGTCLHAIFESLDFEEPDIEMVVRTLRDCGFNEEWAPGLFADFLKLLKKPLLGGEPDLSLGRISKSRRQNELSFLFPIREVSSLPRSLSRLFSIHSAKGGKAYEGALAGLSPFSLSGYMKGFIDLVFEYRDRYYIVDYKSNFLGDAVRDFHPSALEKAMAAHHYYLQYHIYTVAMHRRLGRLIKDYSYDDHFGGVFYLFIRGMTGPERDLNGVFFDRPEKSLIEGMSKLFMGEEPVLEEASKNIQSFKNGPGPTEQAPSARQMALPGFSLFSSDEKGDSVRPLTKRRPRK